MHFNKENLLQTLQGLPELLETYFMNIPEDFLDKKRNDTAWTIREHLYHIVGVQEMLYGRILMIKNEEHPVITPYFPQNEEKSALPYTSIQEAFSSYKEIRGNQILLIQTLTDSDFSKDAKHGGYIQYNIPLIMNHMIFHEYWHIYRIEDIWLTKDEYFI